MEITKEGAQSLRMKMPNARVVFERNPQLFTAFTRLQQDCSN